MDIIGIAGGKGTGKDTVASRLMSRYGFQRFAFGDPIKEALAVMFRVDIAIFHDEETKETPNKALLGFTPRHLMQTLGTEWGRDVISQTLWSDLLVTKLKKIQYRGIRRIVVPDVRFASEAKAIRDLGGHVWQVHRNTTIYAPGDTHRSEHGLEDRLVSDQLDNNGTKELLHNSIGALLEKTFGAQR